MDFGGAADTPDPIPGHAPGARTGKASGTRMQLDREVVLQLLDHPRKIINPALQLMRTCAHERAYPASAIATPDAHTAPQPAL